MQLGVRVPANIKCKTSQKNLKIKQEHQTQILQIDNYWGKLYTNLENQDM